MEMGPGPDTWVATAVVVAPGAAANIVTLTPGVAGVYEVEVLVGYGSVGGGEADFQLAKSGVVMGKLFSTAGSNVPEVRHVLPRVTLTGADVLAVQAVAGSAGHYIATIMATKVG